VTLDEVARASGVSRATASRALNGRDRVSPDVRHRVHLVARALGYRPNPAARSLASGRSGAVGLVLPTVHLGEDPYEANLVTSVAEAATRQGQALMLWLAPVEPSPSMRDHFRTGLVDGLVISGVGFGARWVEDLIDGPHPSVLVGRHPTRTDVVSVQIDNLAGARAAVEHLLAGGSRRVGIVLGPIERTDSQDRMAGYRRALAAHGLEVEPDLVVEGDFTSASGYEAVQRLLPARPDAVFATNDLMAVGALRAIQEHGLRVPGDVAVVGFDDFAVAATTDPPLTTVSHDIRRVGEAAVEALLGLLDPGAEPPANQVVPAPLVVRQSTHPAPVPVTGAPTSKGTEAVTAADVPTEREEHHRPTTE
jgi:LacI family transcriptional regulator